MFYTREPAIFFFLLLLLDFSLCCSSHRKAVNVVVCTIQGDDLDFVALCSFAKELALLWKPSDVASFVCCLCFIKGIQARQREIGKKARQHRCERRQETISFDVDVSERYCLDVHWFCSFPANKYPPFTNSRMLFFFLFSPTPVWKLVSVDYAVVFLMIVRCAAEVLWYCWHVLFMSFTFTPLSLTVLTHKSSEKHR